MSEDTTVPLPVDGPLPVLPGLDTVRGIGSGGYGDVWLAANQTTGSLLAVKTIRLDRADKAGRELASIVRMESAFRGQHENLLTIHHVAETPQYFYYTMDAADDISGGPPSRDAGYRAATLAARLEAAPLPPTEALALARQLLAGLACLHGKGLAHRDVKPSNCVFVGGKLKLADFGLVTRADGTVSRLGTPKYMPPDGRMDACADVYAAGLVIYEMFMGLLAGSFPRWSSSAIEASHGDSTLVALNRLVLRACRPERASRFQNAGEMLTALDRSLEAVRPRLRWSRRRLLLGLAGLASAVALGVVGWWPGGIRRVDVNFITVPFDAEIYLDGNKLVDAQGMPYKTPCTVPDLPARTHHVVFRKAGYPDLAAGSVDFAREREVQREWPSETQDR